MKAIICFSTIVLFTLFTFEENKLSQINLDAGESRSYSLPISYVWDRTKKIGFSAVFKEFSANLLPVVSVYLLNEDVPSIER